ncbi:MAG TPA: thioesterase family protein [Candidatus Kapabacteria bacterium]|nr:thioesterase family protein [Candidatus Kapabacteria bacterium]
MSEVLFQCDGDLYVPTALAGSPWHPALLHGGAPAGLLAHCLEQSVGDPRLQPSRLTIDLIRPVPNAPLSVVLRRIRSGKRIVLEEAQLQADGKTVAIATGLFVLPQSVTVPDYAPARQPLAPPHQLQEVSFRDVLFTNSDNMPPGLHTTVRMRPISSLHESGRGLAWLSLPASIVEGCSNSPFMRAALTSDFSNGVGQLSLGNNVGMINADITLQLFRLPQDEWIGLDATTLVHSGGVGVVTADLHDCHGLCGLVSQTVMPMAEFTR